ncbi:MAG: hypothetical protein Q8R12_00580 [bacterium]|nr:hypothetical protein [bacterium]
MAEADQIIAVEEAYKMRLTMAQKLAQKQKVLKSRGIIGTKINMVEAALILGFAIVMDLIDWLGFGSIPLVGDVFDLGTGAVLYFWVKIRGLDQKKPWFLSWISGGATLVELIPGGDLLPSYTLAVIFIIIMNTAMAQRWLSRVSPI